MVEDRTGEWRGTDSADEAIEEQAAQRVAYNPPLRDASGNAINYQLEITDEAQQVQWDDNLATQRSASDLMLIDQAHSHEQALGAGITIAGVKAGDSQNTKNLKVWESLTVEQLQEIQEDLNKS